MTSFSGLLDLDLLFDYLELYLYSAHRIVNALMPFVANLELPNAQNGAGLVPTPGTPSSSGTGSSPSKTPKRPRDRKRDAETKGLRNKVTDACERTPINLVHVGSAEFTRRQQEVEAKVYQHPVYKQVPHLFHLHIFDPTATPAQLPQFKKNAMLDTRQLYRTWNIMLIYFI